jgi:hypothetical protein
MSNATAIVDTLLETDEADPKTFVSRNTHRVFYSIVFHQSTPEAYEWLQYIDDHGEQKALEAMADTYDGMEIGGEHEASPVPSYGSADDVYTGDYNGHRYILSYNRGLDIVGLERIEDEFNSNE